MLVGSGQKIKQTQQQVKNITENKKEQSKFVKGNIFPQSFVYEFLMIDGYPLTRTKPQDSSFSTTKLGKNLDFGVVINYIEEGSGNWGFRLLSRISFSKFNK